MRGLLLRLSGFILSCVLGLLLLLFALELAFRTSSYADLQIKNPALRGDTFSVQLNSDTTLLFFKGCRCQVEENALYITVYSGNFYTSFHCQDWPVALRVQDAALEGVERVYLQDGASVKKIYPA